MKKLLVLFCSALLGLCAYAQEYQMGAGAYIGLASGGTTHVGIGAKYQYNLSDTTRVQANLEYWAKASGISIFNFSVNAHYLISVSNDNKYKVYPIAGLGIARINWSYKAYGYYDGGDDDFRDEDYEGTEGDWGWGVRPRKIASRSSDGVIKYSSSATRILLNLGAGLQYELTPTISVNFEIVHQLMKDYSRKQILIGATYNF